MIWGTSKDMNLAEVLATCADQVRITSEVPPRYSIKDILTLAIGDQGTKQHYTTYNRMAKQHGLAVAGRVNFGPGHPTPVCTLEEAEQLIALLGGKRAASFRMTGCPQNKRQRRVEHCM